MGRSRCLTHFGLVSHICAPTNPIYPMMLTCVPDPLFSFRYYPQGYTWKTISRHDDLMGIPCCDFKINCSIRLYLKDTTFAYGLGFPSTSGPSQTRPRHYDDVIMTTMASQITSLTIVYSAVYSGAYQRKHQSSASLAFVRVIHRGLVNSPHKWPVTRKMFPFDDVIMGKTHTSRS